jgi:hypothetical protein
MADTEPDADRLAESLRRCRLELAAVREEYETQAERLAPLEDAERRLRDLSTALDQHLTAAERVTPGVKGWIKRRVGGAPAPAPDEVDAVERIRTSPLFDGAWYLQQYPDVVRSRMSPALHFLRHGAAERKDPGPNFDVRAYLRENPDLPRGTNPLLHYQANVPGVAR